MSTPSKYPIITYIGQIRVRTGHKSHWRDHREFPDLEAARHWERMTTHQPHTRLRKKTVNIEDVPAA